MDSLSNIEGYYQNFISNLPFWLPDGKIQVDINLLSQWDLLSANQTTQVDEKLTGYFHVFESLEKITLINDKFIIWITPENDNGVPKTFAFVALNTTQGPHLEAVFEISGVYNNSNLILQILDKFLKEVQENETLLQRYEAI